MSKIMIIDDEKDIACLLETVLSMDNFEVTKAYNGKEAYEKLSAIDNENELPDVIFLDVMMPEMDGYTLQAKLQEHEKLNKIPIIVLTSKKEMKDLFKLSSNIFAFVEKPFNPKDMAKMAHDAINSKKERHT